MHSKLNKIIFFLCKSIGQRKIYFSNHPVIEKNCQYFIAELSKFLAETEEDKLFIGIIENKLVYEGHYLIGPSIMGLQLVKLAKLIHCGGFAFGAETSVTELLRLIDLADHLAHPVSSLQEAREFLSTNDVSNIHLARHYTTPSTLIPMEDQVVWQGEDSGGHLYSPLLVYQALFDVVAKAYGNVSLNRSIDISGAQAVSEHLISSTRVNFTDILQFVHYPDHDSYTVGHSVRVATLAVFIGDILGLDNEHLVELGTAALLHDVGKGKIPSEIIYKRGKLNQDEYALIQSHAALGAEILLEHKDSTRMQVAAAWGHHIRYDGGGYPKLPPWAIRSHMTALLQICDVFEALTAVRPYKPSMSPLSAFGIMANDTGAFDPALFLYILFFAFISALGIYPPGNQVRLNSGCKGMVIASGKAIDKPVVRITHDNAGNKIESLNQQIIDLSKDTGEETAIVELLL